MRTGSSYLAALDDGRSVFVDGSRVANITDHPGFAGISDTIAKLFDIAVAEPDVMTYTAPDTGQAANRVFMIPRSREDLTLRRHAIARWARHSGGFVGRSPDHVGAFFAGFASQPEVFDRDSWKGGDNVVRFYRRILDESLFVSYSIIPPNTGGPAGTTIRQVEAVGETAEGIIVSGAQVLGTSSAVSDYLFVSCIRPLGATEESKALSFVVPMNAQGLRLHCRRPYAQGVPSSFDYPMSTRFDETDGVLVFDNVLVPWEDVFIYRDVQGAQEQFHRTPAHVLGNSQAQVRFSTKMTFLLGLTRRLMALNGIDGSPPVIEKMGELCALVGMVEGMVLGAESTSDINQYGVAVPNRRFVYAPMGLQSEVYPRALGIMRELASSSILQVPSSYRDLLSEETRDDVLGLSGVNVADGEARIKLLKLVWDVVGSEFAGRHHQYEMFYAGSPFVARSNAYRNFGFDESLAMVDQFLSTYQLPESASTRAAE